MAASQNFSEFYGPWFAIRPANQKLELFYPQESTTSLAGTRKGGKSSHELSSLFGVNCLNCSTVAAGVAAQVDEGGVNVVRGPPYLNFKVDEGGWNLNEIHQESLLD